MPHDRPNDRNEGEIADRIARQLSERGTPVRRESAGGHEFILRQTGDGSETELMWIACNRTVGESHVEQLKQSAASVGASGVCIVTTAAGDLQTSTGPDVSHRTVSDLSVQVGEDGTPHDGVGEDGTPHDGVGEDETPHDGVSEPGSPSHSTELSPWDGLTVEASETHAGGLWAAVTGSSDQHSHSPSRSPWDQSTVRTDR